MAVSRYKISLKKKHKRLLRRIRSSCLLSLFYLFIKHIEHWGDDEHDHRDARRLDQMAPEYRHEHKNTNRKIPDHDWNTNSQIVIRKSSKYATDDATPARVPRDEKAMQFAGQTSVISRGVVKWNPEKEKSQPDRKSETDQEHLHDKRLQDHVEQANAAFEIERQDLEQNAQDGPVQDTMEIEDEVRGFHIDEVENMNYDDISVQRVTQKPSQHLAAYRRKKEKLMRQYEKVKGAKPQQPKSVKMSNRKYVKNLTQENEDFWKDAKKSDDNPSAEPQVDLKTINWGAGACTPHKHFIFLKTHKTASTTISNICIRFAEKNKAVLGLPPTGRWELGGYPAFIDAYFVTPRIDPKVQRYEAMCHHSRYHKRRLDAITYDDKKVFTVLRDPVDNFESNFGFFRDYPYKQWLGDDYLKKFDTFLSNPGWFYDKSTPWYFRAKNYQSFDLGLDNDDESPEYIANSIDKLEQEIDLVMITEMIDESLILLKDLLCMDIDDIVYLKLKIRKNQDRQEEPTLSPLLQKKIRNWNQLDQSLYTHFKHQLEQKIDLYGSEQMRRDKDTLQRKLEQVEEHCVARYDSFPDKPWISKLILKHPVDRKCEKLSLGEVRAGDDVRHKQTRYMENYNKKNEPDTQRLIHELRKVQRAILGDDVKFV